MFEFLYAKHRDTYLRLAFQHYISPNRVWKLAHGSRAKSNKERLVQHELLDLGIIHRSGTHKHHHSTEHHINVDPNAPATTPAYPEEYAEGARNRAATPTEN